MRVSPRSPAQALVGSSHGAFGHGADKRARPTRFAHLHGAPARSSKCAMLRAVRAQHQTRSLCHAKGRVAVADARLQEPMAERFCASPSEHSLQDLKAVVERLRIRTSDVGAGRATVAHACASAGHSTTRAGLLCSAAALTSMQHTAACAAPARVGADPTNGDAVAEPATYSPGFRSVDCSRHGSARSGERRTSPTALATSEVNGGEDEGRPRNTERGSWASSLAMQSNASLLAQIGVCVCNFPCQSYEAAAGC